MQKLQFLLFVLKRSYICYNIICMTVPLNQLFIRRSYTEINFFKKKWFDFVLPILTVLMLGSYRVVFHENVAFSVLVHWYKW